MGAEGVAGESETIRIGGGNKQTKTFIEGINGASSDDKDEEFDVDVCIDQFDQLGPCLVMTSSSRFKEAIKAMGDTATAVAALRPVTFRYKPGLYQDTEQLQYGLIAEEVAKVFPTLVSFDDEGKPYTVRYDMLTPLLLNEVQRQEEVLERQAGELEALRKEVTSLKRKKRFRSD